MTLRNQTRKENQEQSQEQKYFRCIKQGCNAQLEGLHISKNSNYDIFYFKCKKCNDLSYFLYAGDTYDREIFTLDDYQNFLTRVDDDISSRRQREKELKKRERAVQMREDEFEKNKGFRGLLRRIFNKNG